MGLSAKDSRIFYVPKTCPVRLDGTPPSGMDTGSTSDGASGSASGSVSLGPNFSEGGDAMPAKRRRAQPRVAPQGFSEQVTRIEITPSVSQRKYGHDKSYGAQDVCSGIKSWDGSITTKLADTSQSLTLTAGDTVWIRVWPLGVSCGSPLQGYGVIDSDPIVCNIENGEPVEHNYRFSSKGLWTGFPHSSQPWGGYECECGNDSGGSGGSGGSVAVAPATDDDSTADIDDHVHQPVTAYQWNGTAWLRVYDEATEGFVGGAVPVEPGAFVGQLSFSLCEAG